MDMNFISLFINYWVIECCTISDIYFSGNYSVFYLYSNIVMKTDNCNSYSAMEVGLPALPSIRKELQAAPVEKSFINEKVCNDNVNNSEKLDAAAVSVQNGFSALGDNSVSESRKISIEKVESSKQNLGNAEVNVTKDGKTDGTDDTVSYRSCFNAVKDQLPMEVEENIEKMEIDSGENMHPANSSMDVDDEVSKPTILMKNSQPQESIIRFNEPKVCGTRPSEAMKSINLQQTTHPVEEKLSDGIESKFVSDKEKISYLIEELEKSPTEKQMKFLGEKSDKSPVEKSGESPAEESRKFIAEESSKSSTEESSKSSTEESSESSLEEPNKSLTEESRKSPVEVSIKSSAEVSSKSPAEVSILCPTEESTKSPVDDSSKSSAEESSKSPVEKSYQSLAETSCKFITRESKEESSKFLSEELSKSPTGESNKFFEKESVELLTERSNQSLANESINASMVEDSDLELNKSLNGDKTVVESDQFKFCSPFLKEVSDPLQEKIQPSSEIDVQCNKNLIDEGIKSDSESNIFSHSATNKENNENQPYKIVPGFQKVNQSKSGDDSDDDKSSTKSLKFTIVKENTTSSDSSTYNDGWSGGENSNSSDSTTNVKTFAELEKVDDSTFPLISANNSASATFDIFSSQQTMLAGITDIKKMPSVSPSPMINIPAGVVKEFLSDSIDDEICKNLNNNVKNETTKPNGTDDLAKDITDDLDKKLIPSESAQSGKSSNDSLSINLDVGSLSPKPAESLDMVADATPVSANMNESIGGTKRSLSGEDTKEDYKKPRLSSDDDLGPLKIYDTDEETELEKKEVKCADMMIEKKDAKRKFDDIEVDEEVKKIKKLSRKLHKMSRKDLENSIVELFINKLLFNHQLGEYKTLVEKLENNLETSRKKVKQFHKELEDMRKVTKRLQDEHVARKDHIVTPIKIKRSVGIQASPQIIQKGVVGAQTNPASVPAAVTYKSISPRVSNNAITLQNSIANTTILNNTNGSVVQSGLANKNPIMLLNTSNGTRHYVPLPIQQTVQNNANKQYFNALLQNKAVNHQTSPSSNVVKSNQGVIDLTDEEENRNINSIAKSTLVNQSGNAIPPGFVALSQSSGASTPTQYVIVPNGSVSGAAVMVANVNHQANSSSLQNVSTTSTPTRLVAVPSTNILQNGSTGAQQVKLVPQNSMMHPAPLPRTAPQQVVGSAKQLPSTPTLKLSHKENSIVLSWTMNKTPDTEAIASYQLYAYQESSAPPSPNLWKKVGSVKALELPMACTLTQFMPGHRYHFAVRAVDAKSRLGPFSEPKSINLVKKLFA